MTGEIRECGEWCGEILLAHQSWWSVRVLVAVVRRLVLERAKLPQLMGIQLGQAPSGLQVVYCSALTQVARELELVESGQWVA
jgi:hypothetical protein